MRAMPLQLSHWDDEAVVSVPASVVASLKSYHLHGVRFLYACYRKKFKGAILNHDPGMNFPQQVAAFFSALHEIVKSPVLVVCAEKTLRAWHYHFSEGGCNVTVLSLKNCEEVEEKEVVLAVVDDVKLLQKIKGVYFFAVVVEDLDEVVTKLIIKQLKGEFNIGLTTRNFMKNRDLKLLWNVMKWTSHSVPKFDEFSQEDGDSLKNMKNPYPEWWQTLTWNFCETFKQPTEEEQKDYKAKIAHWAKQQNLKKLPEANPPQKRKATRTTRSKQIKIEKHSDDTGESPTNLKNDTTQPSSSKTQQTKNRKTTKATDENPKGSASKTKQTGLKHMLSESSDEGDNIEKETDARNDNKNANSENTLTTKTKQTKKRQRIRATRSKMLSESSDEDENEAKTTSENSKKQVRKSLATRTKETRLKCNMLSESSDEEDNIKIKKTSKTKQTQKLQIATTATMLNLLSESSDEDLLLLLLLLEEEEKKEKKSKRDEESTSNDSTSSDDTIIYDIKTSPKSVPTEEINLDSTPTSTLFDLNPNSVTSNNEEQTNGLYPEKSVASNNEEQTNDVYPDKRNEILSLLYGDQ